MRALLGTHLARYMALVLPECHLRHRLASEGQALALTFEGGPHPESTPLLLDLLDRLQISATFFIVGEQASCHPDLLEQIALRGHELGNHTYHHADTWRVSTIQAIREIRQCSQIIDSVTGSYPTWWRPPFGHVTKKLVTISERQGLKTALWDLSLPNFSSRSRAEKIGRTLEQNVRPGSIVALQDAPESVDQTLAALENSLPLLQGQGWLFTTLSAQHLPVEHSPLALAG